MFLPRLRFIDLDKVLAIHQKVIESGPDDAPRYFGLRHEGGVSAALERCAWGPFEIDDLEERAALLLRGLCQDHPFEDGNKRTAIIAADAFLRLNGRAIETSYEDAERFIFAVARGELDVPEIASWLRSHTTNL